MVSPDHRYTNIAAQRVPAASGKLYDVLFLLTGMDGLEELSLAWKGKKKP